MFATTKHPMVRQHKNLIPSVNHGGGRNPAGFAAVAAISELRNCELYKQIPQDNVNLTEMNQQQRQQQPDTSNYI